MISVAKLAEQLNKALVQDKRADGTTFTKLDDDKRQEWMRDAIFEASNSADLDTGYEWVERCVEALEYVDEDEDNDSSTYEEAIAEIEPDIYTRDLTEWLHRSASHVYYITQALEELGEFKDGFNLLGAAQQLQIHEVGYALLKVLRDIADDLGDKMEEDAETEEALFEAVTDARDAFVEDTEANKAEYVEALQQLIEFMQPAKAEV